MSIAELKNDLIQLAIETDNPAVLEKVILFFQNLREKEDWWDALTPQQRQFIERSSLQIEDGDFVESSTVRKEAKLILGN